jgi:multidrug resistance efflux pump
MSAARERLPALGATGLDLEGLPLESGVLLRSPRGWRIVYRWVVALTVAGVVILFLPWQQSVQGKGKVTALRPQDRPQVVPTVIAGRIDRWLVAEGQYVERGTPLVQLSEVKEQYLDPQYVTRLGEQVAGKSEAVRQKRDKVVANDSLVAALTRARELTLQKAANKVQLYQAAYEAAVVDSAVAADQQGRMRLLERDGLLSVNSVQGYVLKAQQSNAKLEEKRQELGNARLEVSSVAAEYAEKIAKARSDRDGTLAEIGEGSAEVAKLVNQHRTVELRNGLYRIVAPQDGIVIRASQAGIGELVKEGEGVVSLVPRAPASAVELYVNANDVPLVQPGRRVRLQFDGWPALQFSGWPSAMVGTFGGIVRVVDQVGNAAGQFRVLVTPDPMDTAWPRQLRMNSGVYGWAMLDRVPLWFELWRQVNGFRPTIAAPDGDAAAGGKSAAASPKGK